MNSFNKTEAAVFSCRLCFLRAFPFISFFVRYWIKARENKIIPRLERNVNSDHAFPAEQYAIINGAAKMIFSC